MGISANLVSSNNDNLNTSSLDSEIYRSPGNYIPVGTGFFVGGSKTGGEIVFNNSQREFRKNDISAITDNESDKGLIGSLLDILPIIEFDDPNQLPIIKLGLDYKNEDETIHRQIGISFNKNNSFDIEKGYDSELFDENETDFYWKFKNDENKYSIAGVQEISQDLEVPLEIIMNYSGEIFINVDEIRSIENKIFLKDKVANTSYDLSERVDLQLESGTYSDRFYLTFTSSNGSAKSEEIIEEEKPKFEVSFRNATKELIITKNKEVKIRRVSLFSIYGKRLQSWKIRNQQEQLNLSTRRKVRDEIYIVRIRTNEGVVNTKIYVE
jgi:hypothetical protein